MREPLVILGCTASGKSDLAEALAVRVAGASVERPATIMAVDSMQVYRGMDIGTAKPTAETRGRIPHVMIDVAEAWESYSAARFVAEARPILEGHLREGRPIILVAGTILYLRALLEGLFEGPSANAEVRAELEKRAAEIGVPGLHAELARVDALAASRIHANDLRRIVRALEVFKLTGTPISTLQTQWNREHPVIAAKFIGIERGREELNRRINARVREMMGRMKAQRDKGTEAQRGEEEHETRNMKHETGEGDGGERKLGLLEEVRRLAAEPRGMSKEAASGVGYRQLLDHLAGKCSLEEAVEQIKIQTRHLAKLQRTWLKRFVGVRWVKAAEGETGETLAAALGSLDA